MASLTETTRRFGPTLGVRLPLDAQRFYEEESEREGIPIASLIRRAVLRDIRARRSVTESNTDDTEGDSRRRQVRKAAVA